jgi:hypothetical protein
VKKYEDIGVSHDRVRTDSIGISSKNQKNVENEFSFQPTLFPVGSLVENGSLSRLRDIYSQPGMGSVYKMNWHHQ